MSEGNANLGRDGSAKGTVRLEQSYRQAFGSVWYVIAILAVPVAALIALGVMTWFMAAMALVVLVLLYPVLRDTNAVSRQITLNRADGTVERNGMLGKQRSTNASRFSSAELGTWRRENVTLMLGFDDQDVVLRTGDIPEVATMVEALNRAKADLGSGPPVALTLTPRDRELDRRVATNRNRGSHHFALSVDGAEVAVDELDSTTVGSEAVLNQRIGDLYRWPILMAAMTVVSFVLNAPSYGSQDSAPLLTVLGVQAAILAVAALVFWPLTWNARRIELDMTSGEVRALVMRRWSLIGNVADGVTATATERPFGLRQVVLHVGNGSARLRTDNAPVVRWWLKQVGACATRTGASVDFDDSLEWDPQLVSDVQRRKKVRGHWTLTIDGSDPPN